MNIEKLFKAMSSPLARLLLPPKMEQKEGQAYMTNLLNSESPCMVGRFGSVEIQATLSGILPPPVNEIFKKRIYRGLLNNAGFFPVNRKNVKRFSRLLIDAMKECDILASWRFEEFFFARQLKNAKKIALGDLGPNPEISTWYSALEHKKVLVISPFAELIVEQYNNKRELIWPGSIILPEFTLYVLKAENTIGGNSRHLSWFDALEYMEEEIRKIDFDIAIIGCGAYGFPLAAFVKSIGKKSVHIGGSLQLIFGIKGKRWEHREFINDAWVSPREQDKPLGWEKVENGCYW